MARQRDGILPWFPIWDDITTFRSDNLACSEYFDFLRSIRRKLVISGGFPCQDIAAAGPGTGLDGARSGLWFEMARVVREVGPSYMFMENSALLVSRGLGRVLRDLAEMGYHARWGVLGGGHIGAWHLRERIWLVASNHREERIQGRVKSPISGKRGIPWSKDVRGVEDLRRRPAVHNSGLCRGSNGMADYVDRISAIGNGQIPAVASLAWQLLA